jgi:Uncharacterized protein conserved in bacteria (DUF2252)
MSSSTVEIRRGPFAKARRYPVSSGVAQLGVAERAARGRAARGEVPRSSHAVFEPAAHRLDPIGLLERQADARVPELVPVRYGRTLVSPFTFYRGAALIRAADRAATPRSGLLVQCCGDAHLSNFGPYASPEPRLVFDINDFDETLPGPWEWDVKRLAVSMFVAARSSAFSGKVQERIVLDTVGEYRSGWRSSPRDAKPRCLVHAFRDRGADASPRVSDRWEDAQATQQSCQQGNDRDSLQALASSHTRSTVSGASSRIRRSSSVSTTSRRPRSAIASGPAWSASFLSTAPRSSTSAEHFWSSSG